MAAETVSRRGFLQRAGAALAAPAFVPASARGRDGHVAPSERIVFAAVGLGGQGSGHVFGGAWTYVVGGLVATAEVQMVAVCDVWGGRRDGACQRVNAFYADKLGQADYGGCAAYHDYGEVLARDDIDAVMIATPVHWHAPMSLMAAAAGKDVYCEKPTALGIDQSRRMADTFERYGRVFQAGTQQRSEYQGMFRQACEYVRSGRIGRLTEVYANIAGGCFVWPGQLGAPQPAPADLDWDRWLGPAPFVPFDGNLDSHRFGSGGINWGQHHYDIVQWALDADRGGPIALDIEDGHAVYTYPGGVTVHGCPYPGEPVGDTGGATFVGTEGRIAVDREDLVSYPASILREPLQPGDVHLGRGRSHMMDFLHCVRTRGRPICDAETAHRAASALILGGIVQQLGRPLTWDPITERFGDDEADRLLTVAQRAPWGV